MKRQGGSGGGWDNPIGIGNNIRIWKIISKSSASGEGITKTEISKQSHLSRQTVDLWVNKLFKKGMISKDKNNRYFMKDDMADDYWITLAYYLEYLLICGSIARFRVDPIQFNLLNSDGTDNLEGALFKMANRVGAFIIFVLIEAMRPSKKIMSPIMRRRMNIDFIKSSIPLDDLFRTFINMLPDAISNDIIQRNQIKKAGHDRLSSAFKHVYPSIYKALVDGLDEYLDLLDSQSSSGTKSEKM